jgi:phage terminase small subunit
MWRSAVETLAATAERDPVTHGLLIKRTDGAARNPLVKIAANAASNMIRYGAEFGLTPVARSRIAAAGFEPPDGGRFAGLLGG